MDNALKIDRIVIFHACAEKSLVNRLYRRYHMCKIWLQFVFGCFITGCPKMPISYQNGGDHYNSVHCRAAVIFIPPHQWCKLAAHPSEHHLFN